MAIEKYTTPAIVIESFDQGEHDRVYKLFTRDFGMLIAHAKSVRKLESKLRAHVLPRTMSLVTLVQGREVWRLVGAEEQKGKGKMIGDVVVIINRLVRGEGAHKALYNRLMDFLEAEASFDKQKSRLLLYFVCLVELGYADAKAIGAKDIKEYIQWDIGDLYTHLLLSYDTVRAHVHEVMKEMQL
jgi:recombinational DNA repair protein (RecF pathway)